MVSGYVVELCHYLAEKCHSCARFTPFWPVLHGAVSENGLKVSQLTRSDKVIVRFGSPCQTIVPCGG
jgi:hypothetical protein